MSTIYLSPSKQESNVGYGNYGTEEQRMNQIVDAMIPYLDASGVGHYRNNPAMSTIQIVSDSDNKKPNFHLAIHSNAANRTARGCEVLVYQNGGERERMATILYNKISALTPSGDRGVKADSRLTELKLTDAPACLVEVAFHDNAEDAAFIVNNIKAIAQELAEGVCEYFNVAFVDPYYVAPAPVAADYVVRVTADVLRIRSGPGTGYAIAGRITDKGAYTIVEEQSGWGKLKSGAGWIALAHTNRI